MESSPGWSAGWARVGGGLVLAGGLLPLYKHSLVFGADVVVWPWQLAGVGMDTTRAAAMATDAFADHLAVWALLPVVLGIAALGAARVCDAAAQARIMATVGLGGLAALLVALPGENGILGLALAPPTAGGGAVALVGVGACALAAAANHVARTDADAPAVPRLLRCAGAVIAPLALFGMVPQDGPWAAWPVRLLALAILGYALLCLWGGVSAEQTVMRSRVARAIVVGAPLAMVLAQRSATDGFVHYVVEAGGGGLSTLIGAVKGFFVFAGLALLAAGGMATGLESRRSAEAAIRGGRAVLMVAPIALLLGACSRPPADLAAAADVVGEMLSRHNMSRSQFRVFHPDGQPSDFVRFFFSPLGRNEWPPEPDGPEGLSGRDLRSAGITPMPPGITFVEDRAEPSARRQLVLSADDARGVVIAKGYLSPDQAPMLVREWRLPPRSP